MKKEDTYIDFENSIAPWLGRTVKNMDYVLQESFKANHLDLSKEQMVVLKKLDENDGINQNELAFLTLRNKSTLTRLLTKMERKGYILRQQSAIDKRVNNVFLTELGKDMYVMAKPVVKDVLLEIERCISEVEKKQIINTLKKIQQNLNTKIESF